MIRIQFGEYAAVKVNTDTLIGFRWVDLDIMCFRRAHQDHITGTQRIFAALNVKNSIAGKEKEELAEGVGMHGEFGRIGNGVTAMAKSKVREFVSFSLHVSSPGTVYNNLTRNAMSIAKKCNFITNHACI